MSPVMPPPPASTTSKPASQGSNSSSTISFEDDSAFLAALAEADLTPPTAAGGTHAQSVVKGKQRQEVAAERSREEQEDLERSIALAEEEEEERHRDEPGIVRIRADRVGAYGAAPKPVESSLKRTRFDDAAGGEPGPSSAAATAYLDSATYAPTKFGDFRSFMKNKRAKLKVQETSLVTDESSSSAGVPALFAGTNSYINGHTDPPYNELRRLLLLYGGEHMAYLDTKSPCTHIIASSLTPKKRIEFKDYRVVTPQWVTASIAAGKRLDWRNFRCGADAAGAMGFGVKMGRAGVSQLTQQTQGKADWRSVGQAVAASQSQRQGLVPTHASLSAAPRATPMASSSSIHEASSKPPHSPPLPESTFARQAAISPKATAPWGQQSAQRTLGAWVSRPAAAAAGAGASREATPPPSTAEELPRMTITTPSRARTTALAGVVTPPTSSPSTEAIASSSRLPGELPAAPVAVSDAAPAALAPKPPNALQLLGQRTPSSKAAHPIYGAYSARPSNTSAARLLSSASWRSSNTACADTYLARYFAMSRLHHLSTWKLEMQDMVAQAVLESGRAEGSQDLPEGVQRVIFHIDFDAFFVNVGLRARSELRDKPVVVCHGTKEDSAAPLGSTSEIASCNYVARDKGIRNGMSLGNARKLCRDVNTIPYDFEAYNEVSIQLYTVLLAHADVLEAVSVDEALLDVSMLLHSMRQGDVLRGAGEEDDERRALTDAYRGHLSSQGLAWTEEKQLAEALRDRVRNVTSCEVSIGVGSDVLQARLATRKAKPAGSFHLRPEAVLDFTAALEVDDLHGVGWKMRGECLDKYGTVNVGELRRRVTQARLIADQGAVAGPKLWNKLHGRERDRLEGYKVRKSLSACVNYGIRFVSRTEAEDFVTRLCGEVSRRLKKAKLRGGKVVVDIMVRKASAPVEAPKFLGHGVCDKYHKSKDPPSPIVEAEDLFKYAWPMIKLIAPEATELRGIAISLHKLEPIDGSAPLAPQQQQGQSLLNFQPVARPVAAPLESPAQKLAPVQEEQEEEEEDPLPPLLPGVPAPSRRSLTPEPAPRADVPAPKPTIKPSRPPVAPAAAAAAPRKAPIATLAATQFALPSISQIDPDVLPQLPRHIVAQIEAAQSARAASEDAARALSTEPPTLLHQAVARAEQSRQSSEAPGARDKSISPLKRKGASSSSKLPVPILDDIDPEVLAALPSEMREEILREAGIRSRSAPGTRSLSESPRKKQRTVNRVVPRSATSGSLQPFVRADQPRVKAAVQAADPGIVSTQQLVALEIDAEFYRGLPVDVQRELLLQQERVMESKRRRFKGGRRIQERTTAEERRFDAEKAAKLADAKAAERGDYQPLVLAVLPSGEAPAIRGRSETKEVVLLLEGWYAQFRNKGPRETDVARFAGFLEACVKPQHARSIDMDKASTILKCWKRLLGEEEAGDTEAQEASDKWNAAFETVYQQISDLVRQRFGFGLSLK